MNSRSCCLHSLTATLVSRFLLDLQIAKHHASGQDTTLQSGDTLVFGGRLLGSLGSSLVPEHTNALDITQWEDSAEGRTALKDSADEYSMSPAAGGDAEADAEAQAGSTRKD